MESLLRARDQRPEIFQASFLFATILASLPPQKPIFPLIRFILELLGVHSDCASSSGRLLRSGIDSILFAANTLALLPQRLSGCLSEYCLDSLSKNVALRLLWPQYAAQAQREIAKRQKRPHTVSSMAGTHKDYLTTSWPPGSTSPEEKKVTSNREKVLDAFCGLISTCRATFSDPLWAIADQGPKMWKLLALPNMQWFCHIFVSELINSCYKSLPTTAARSIAANSDRTEKLGGRVYEQAITGDVLHRVSPSTNPLLTCFSGPELVFAQIILVANDSIFSSLLLQTLHERIIELLQETTQAHKSETLSLTSRVAYLRVMAKFCALLLRLPTTLTHQSTLAVSHPQIQHLIAGLNVSDPSRLIFNLMSALSYASHTNTLTLYVPWILDLLRVERQDRVFRHTKHYCSVENALLKLYYNLRTQRELPPNLFVTSMLEMFFSEPGGARFPKDPPRQIESPGAIFGSPEPWRVLLANLGRPYEDFDLYVPEDSLVESNSSFASSFKTLVDAANQRIGTSESSDTFTDVIRTVALQPDQVRRIIRFQNRRRLILFSI
jgi:hypothetical protein